MVQVRPLSLSRPFEPSYDRPLSEELYLYLQAAIRSGELAPGQRLVEDAIAAATSVSRTPVREALRKLVNGGLAVQGGRGLVVARLSSYELKEITDVIEALYVTGVRLAANNRSEVHIAELRHLLQAEEAGDPSRSNARFRETLFRAAGNRYLANLLEMIVGQSESLVDFTPARARPEVADEHAAIVDAIEQRDPDAAQVAMQAHIRANLMAVLVQRQADDETAFVGASLS